jgi:hypothetical protein
LNRGPLEWHYLSTKFHENLPIGSKVISGGQTDRQATGDLISLLSFLESMLKKDECANKLLGAEINVPELSCLQF